MHTSTTVVACRLHPIWRHWWTAGAVVLQSKHLKKKRYKYIVCAVQIGLGLGSGCITRKIAILCCVTSARKQQRKKVALLNLHLWVCSKAYLNNSRINDLLVKIISLAIKRLQQLEGWYNCISKPLKSSSLKESCQKGVNLTFYHRDIGEMLSSACAQEKATNRHCLLSYLNFMLPSATMMCLFEAMVLVKQMAIFNKSSNYMEKMTNKYCLLQNK